MKRSGDMKLVVYTSLDGISKEKIEEYKNSKEWNELDSLFDQLNSKESNLESQNELMTKILAYGEIVRVKFKDDFSKLKKGENLASSFLQLPIYLDMPYDLAIDVLKYRASENEEKRLKATKIFLDYNRDKIIEELIKSVYNGEKNNNREHVVSASRELIGIGKYALPRLKLVMMNKDSPQQLLDDISTVILFIILGEKKAVDLIEACKDENKDIWVPAQEEIRNVLRSIDPTPYFYRHPKELDKYKSTND